jgi:hypothetical protein
MAMTATSVRTDYLAFCCTALIMAPEPAAACVLDNPAEYLGSAVALSVRFWFASFVLGALILCFDLYERTLSLLLPVAGWLVFLWGAVVYRSVIARSTGYLADCSVPLLDSSQYVLGLLSALFGYRVYRAIRSN